MVYINAISTYLPETGYSNEQILKEYLHYSNTLENDISVESIYKQTGVKMRYSSNMEDTSKDLGNRASIKLFTEWEIDKSHIDYIVFVSDALDYKGPTTACIVQNDLGLETHLGAIDILHGCTGWVYGLSIAKALLESEQAKNVLLITADVPTKVIHPSDLELRALFSDGAAATLVSLEKRKNTMNFALGKFVFGTDGRGEKNLWVERSATREPADIEWLKQHEHLPTKLVGGRLRMNSAKIFTFAIRKVPQLIKDILHKHDLQKEDIDFFILHQANGTMLELLRKRMKIPMEKFIINVEKTGNTVSSSIPFAVREVFDFGRFKPGDKILIAGFGIGYSWGGTVLEF